MTTSECKSCGARIVWVVLPSGKSMPLDAVAATMFVLEPEGAQDGSPRAKAIQVRASHFSSCPQAGQWRKDPAR